MRQGIQNLFVFAKKKKVYLLNSVLQVVLLFQKFPQVSQGKLVERDEKK